jgi:hypothetical protein
MRLRVAGYALSAIALVALATLIGRELTTWYPAATPIQQKYFGQRILYVLGTNTDLPVLQILLAGIVLCVAARGQKRDTSTPAMRPGVLEAIPSAITQPGGSAEVL